jgi:hypothetical protein
MFKSLNIEGYPVITDFCITPTQKIKLEKSMIIGLLPFHEGNYKIVPHINKKHVDRILVSMKEQLEHADYDVEIISIKDLQEVMPPEAKFTGLKYIGSPKYSLILKCDFVSSTDFLHNYIWLHAYSGTKYESMIASRSLYSFGEDMHLDRVWELTADVLFEVEANAKNINRHLEDQKEKSQ